MTDAEATAAAAAFLQARSRLREARAAERTAWMKKNEAETAAWDARSAWMALDAEAAVAEEEANTEDTKLVAYLAAHGEEVA